MGLYLRRLRLRLLLALLKRIRGPIDLASCRATPDALVAVSGTIALSQFVSNDPDIAMVVTWHCPAQWNLDRLVAAITLICEPPRATFRLRMSWFPAYSQLCDFRFFALASRSETEDHDGRSPPHSGR
jgi:hypothetical protein